jgi:hypothetical protein
MFTNQNNLGGYSNLQDIFYSQHSANESKCAFVNPHVNQNPFNLPRNFSDNYNLFSSIIYIPSSNTANASIIQMASLYTANQCKKDFTDEISTLFKYKP